MAFMITEDCISCGDCEQECPNEAISEGNAQFIIDPDRCTECVGAYKSPQCASVCPIDACVPDPTCPETKKELLKKRRLLHPDKDLVAGTY